MKKLAILAIAALLAGCAAGNRLDYRLSTTPVPIKESASVAVAVLDHRAFVLAGNRGHWIGRVRSIGGIPYALGTTSGEPLAADLQQAILTSFRHGGVHAFAATPGAAEKRHASSADERLLVLEIKEWRSHTYMKHTFSHEIDVSVYDMYGAKLASHQSQSHAHTTNMLVSGQQVLANALTDPAIHKALTTGSTSVPVAANP